VVAWGYNVVGQSTIPAGLTGVTAISAGGYHSLALKNDGTVVAWGWNLLGQSTVPAGLSGVTAIAAGGYHNLAIVPTAPVSCPAGQYNNGSGCVDANPGYYVPVPGAAEQTPCAPGTYQPNAGSVSCILAEAGHYVAVTGAVMQIDCSAGFLPAEQRSNQLYLGRRGFLCSGSCRDRTILVSQGNHFVRRGNRL
jgi:hypothetical protein